MTHTTIRWEGAATGLLPAGSGRPAHTSDDEVTVCGRTGMVVDGAHRIAAMERALGGVPMDCVRWV